MNRIKNRKSFYEKIVKSVEDKENEFRQVNKLQIFNNIINFVYRCPFEQIIKGKTLTFCTLIIWYKIV